MTLALYLVGRDHLLTVQRLAPWWVISKLRGAPSGQG